MSALPMEIAYELDGFLQHLRQANNPLFALGILLVFGFVSGQLARLARLPAMTGQIIAGILIGPYGLNFFDRHVFTALEPVTQFALCLFGLSIGTHLNMRLLHNATRRLIVILLCEILLEPAAIFIALRLFTDITVPEALLLSAIGLLTAPGTILELISEMRAKGILTKTMAAVVALNNFSSIILFAIVSGVAVALINQSDAPIVRNLLPPLQSIAASCLVSAVIAVILMITVKEKSSRIARFFGIMITVLIVAGISDALRLTGILGGMAVGFFFVNYGRHHREYLESISQIERAVVVLFFVLAGAHLDFKQVAISGGAGIVFLFARALSKYSALSLGALLSRSTAPLKKYLGISLFPQAAGAIGFVLLCRETPEFSPIADSLTAIVLASVVIDELLGPILTGIAIRRSGEENKNRQRLLDFLLEEYILVKMKSRDKWSAIRELGAFMHRVHQIREMSVDDLVRSIVEREKMLSTGTGEGVAIPHARIKDGPKIQGVLGISPEGIDFEALDGKPVHLLFLIATPPDHEEQHLLVLASIAQIFMHAPEIKDQLLRAKDAAEAYELLQSRHVDMHNIFLEE